MVVVRQKRPAVEIALPWKLFLGWGKEWSQDNFFFLTGWMVVSFPEKENTEARSLGITLFGQWLS